LYTVDGVFSIPKFLFCSNNFEQGVYKRPRDEALKMKYIGLNARNRQVFVTFDVDREEAGAAWIDAFLPQPTLIVRNPQNGHAHITYMLAHPVATSAIAHFKPQIYLNAIQAAYVQRLGADMRYTGRLTKNPWSTAWSTIENDNLAYELWDLAKWVDLSTPAKAKIVENVEGRNCTIFDTLRLWAYKAIRDYWHDSFDAWEQAVKIEAAKANIFLDQLPPREVSCIARSVAGWTWRHITPKNLAELINQTHTPELQRARINKRWEKESKRAEGLKLLGEGKTTVEIAKLLDVSQRTVQRWALTL
jgi:hypothetical protein